MMLRKLMKEIKSRQKGRDGNEHLQAGMKGFAEGFDLHMLNVEIFLKATWDNIDEDKLFGAGLSPKFYQLQRMMNSMQGSEK